MTTATRATKIIDLCKDLTKERPPMTAKNTKVMTAFVKPGKTPSANKILGMVPGSPVTWEDKAKLMHQQGVTPPKYNSNATTSNTNTSSTRSVTSSPVKEKDKAVKEKEKEKDKANKETESKLSKSDHKLKKNVMFNLSHASKSLLGHNYRNAIKLYEMAMKEIEQQKDDFRFGTDEEFEQWLEFSYSPVRPPFSPITPPPPPKNSKSNKLSSLQECIENLRQENGIVIPTTDHDWFEIDRTDIMVRRSELVKDAVKEGRKKRFSPSKLINVTFVGEPAVDTGGPSREFWYLLVKRIAAQYCRGIDGKLTFERDIQALQLRTADNEESIAGTFQSEEVMGLLGETGYKKPPSFLERWEMCSSIKNYHTLTKVKAETDQFMEGLEALGVLQMIKDNEELMKVFFLPQKEKLIRDYFKTLLEPQFSSASSPYRAADEQTYIFFWDYLDECEDGAITVKQRIIQLGDILKFFTGADQQPVLGFNKPAILQFLHGEGEMYATSSTCDIILRLPTCHKEYTKFAEKITESLINEIYGHV